MEFFQAHLLDIVMALIILVEFGIGAKSGLWKSLTKFLGIIGAIFGAGWISSLLYQPVYNIFGQKAVSKAIDKFNGGTITGLLKDVPIVGETLSSDVTAAVEQAAAELVGKAVQGVLYIVCFFAIWIVLNIAFHAVNEGLEALPIIRGLNKWGGAAVGAAYGLIWCYGLIFLCNRFHWFQASFENSIIVQKLNEYNLINKAIEIFQTVINK